MIFFNDCNTADKLKREFHRLSHLLHPDTADTKSLFIMMNTEYERMKKTINNQSQDRGDHDLVADIRLEMTKLDKLDRILVEAILDDPKFNGYFTIYYDLLPAKITSLLREYVKLHK